jgi:hypothetical protein
MYKTQNSVYIPLYNFVSPILRRNCYAISRVTDSIGERTDANMTEVDRRRRLLDPIGLLNMMMLQLTFSTAASANYLEYIYTSYCRNVWWNDQRHADF